MTVADGGGIFVSYRRQETSHLAGRLHDRLADSFGEDQVFIDVDTIELGVDFAEEIFGAVAACRVLLAIIGPTWLIATDGRGRRRLDDPDDIVRLEVEAALARGVRVIPILVEGATMPARQDLPDSLAGLARRNALTIRHESFRHDAARLVSAIERVLTVPGSATVSGAPGTRPGNASGEVAQKGSRRARDDGARAARLVADAEAIANSLTDEISKGWALLNVAEALTVTNPDRAEHIARSITNEYIKASALSSVSKALAGIDPDRAARLVADAEAVANSLTDEYSKGWARSLVAEALAVTDPDRAERVARSITNEYPKASALSFVAKALAGIDPDRAARLVADAEAVANSLTDEYSKASALSDVAEALAVTDPDRAERIARSITDETRKASALSSVAKVLTATSLSDAT
jgi:hypothetical protein